MQLREVVTTSEAVAAVPARGRKVAALAELLARLEPAEVQPAVGFLTGEPRQGRIGVGWATLAKLAEGVEPPADEPPEPLTVGDLDRILGEIQATTGSGSVGARRVLITALLTRATPAEIDFIRRLLTGELRQGALAGVMAEAIAKAAGVPAAAVRRAGMLRGDLGHTAEIALGPVEDSAGGVSAGGVEGLAAVGLVVGRAIGPMLASSAETVADGLAGLDRASVEWKLDGIRIQVHRTGDAVAVFSRNRNEITGRVPGVVEVVRSFPASELVLDGEALSLTEADLPGLVGRPAAFQDTMKVDSALAPRFFDLLHLDGQDFLDRPLAERLEALNRLVGPWRIPGRVTGDVTEAEAVLAEALAAGHEGVVVKAIDSLYEAGRRGSAWRKVKVPVTLDLVVLGAEWGHGRRRGWLSNLHLGARGPDGGLLMVGKTFKGMTDETLRWQTERFLELETHREGITVFIRPEVVAEIALDGVLSSTRYPGGVALRFARLKRYREDKSPAEADTIESLRALLH